LRRVGSSQLRFAFADSPQGGGPAASSDVTEAKRWLLLRADTKEANDPAAGAGETAHLLERAASLPNLARALLHVAQNKGAAGVDGQSVGEAVEASRSLLPKLCRELRSGSYRPGDVRRVWIPKPGGGQRGLGIPNVVDRVVQQAMLQVLEPVFEPTFHPSSHGFRPNRGAHTAIAEAKEHVQAGFDIVVDLDLEKFFDQVNHQRLLNRLAQRVKDGQFLQIVHRMLKAKVVLPDGARVSSEEGTPQGGPLSPLLSNIVLDELDWELDRRGLRFVRYADDCNIFVRSERSGRRVMDSTRRYIESRLRLKVNEAKSSVGRPCERHFLGFRLVRNPEGVVEVHISARTKQRLDARIRALTPRKWGQSLRTCLDEISVFARGWMAHYRLCTEEGAKLFRRFDAHIRRRLRCIILRQKGRRARYLYRHLRRRGVSEGPAARTAFSSRGSWSRSHTFGLEQAYRNAWFAERIVLLWPEWRRLNPPLLVSGEQLPLFADGTPT
jgi:group II intron reverse transcriptase/maturase